MNEQLQAQLLSQLKDVHAPEAISWWPLAIGWWFLAALVIASSILLVLFIRSRRQQNRYRKLALSELNTHFKNWQTQHDDKAYIAATNNILKRATRTFRPEYVSQYSDAWVDSLDAHTTFTFSQATRYALAHQCYQEHVNADINTLNTEVSEWLKRHKREVHNA